MGDIYNSAYMNGDKIDQCEYFPFIFLLWKVSQSQVRYIKPEGSGFIVSAFDLS